MLDLTFAVDGLQFSNVLAGRCLLNLNQNTHPIIATTKLSKHDIGLAHITRKSTRLANDIISARYRLTNGASWSTAIGIGHHTNRKPNVNQWIIHETPYFHHATKNLLVTNKFNSAGLPLFFRHNIEIQTTPQSGIPNDISVTVSDNAGNIVSPDLYKLIYEADSDVNVNSTTHEIARAVVAHNLRNDPGGIHYFVTYNDIQGNLVKELLNSDRLFKRATTGTINQTSVQNSLSVSKKAALLVYWMQDLGNKFEFRLPDSTQKAASVIDDSGYIWANLPYSLELNEPWLVQIPDFYWIIDDNKRLQIPEFNEQNFCPHYPIMCATNDIAEVVSRNFIRVSNRGAMARQQLPTIAPAFQDGYIYILLYKEESEIPDLAITNNPAYEDEGVDENPAIQWQVVNVGVSSYDNLLYVPIDVYNYSWARTFYPYRAESYTYPNIDMNVFRNRKLQGKTVVFYLVPNYSHQTSAIEYLIYDEDRIIESCSQDGSTGNPAIASTVVGQYYSIAEENSMPLSAPNSIGLAFSTNESSFLQSYVGDGINNYIILGEFSFAETLTEGQFSLVTDIRKLDFISPYDMREHNPHEIAKLPDSMTQSRLAMPELIGLREFRVHWGALKDYNSNSIVSEEELVARLRRYTSAALNNAITYDGVPYILLKDFDVATTTLTVRWLPVPYCDISTPVSGLLYSGNSIDAMTTLEANITDLALTTEHTINVGLNAVYLQFVPYLTKNAVQHIGPRSPIFEFSFKRS